MGALSGEPPARVEPPAALKLPGIQRQPGSEPAPAEELSPKPAPAASEPTAALEPAARAAPPGKRRGPTPGAVPLAADAPPPAGPADKLFAQGQAVPNTDPAVETPLAGLATHSRPANEAHAAGQPLPPAREAEADRPGETPPARFETSIEARLSNIQRQSTSEPASAASPLLTPLPPAQELPAAVEAPPGEKLSVIQRQADPGGTPFGRAVPPVQPSTPREPAGPWIEPHQAVEIEPSSIEPPAAGKLEYRPPEMAPVTPAAAPGPPGAASPIQAANPPGPESPPAQEPLPSPGKPAPEIPLTRDNTAGERLPERLLSKPPEAAPAGRPQVGQPIQGYAGQKAGPAAARKPLSTGQPSIQRQVKPEIHPGAPFAADAPVEDGAPLDILRPYILGKVAAQASLPLGKRAPQIRTRIGLDKMHLLQKKSIEGEFVPVHPLPTVSGPETMTLPGARASAPVSAPYRAQTASHPSHQSAPSSPASSEPLPLPPPPRPAPAPQPDAEKKEAPTTPRASVEAPAAGPAVEASPPVTIIQREEIEESEGKEVDLEALAQDILPLIKRLLSIERERGSFW